MHCGDDVIPKHSKMCRIQIAVFCCLPRRHFLGETCSRARNILQCTIRHPKTSKLRSASSTHSNPVTSMKPPLTGHGVSVMQEESIGQCQEERKDKKRNTENMEFLQLNGLCIHGNKMEYIMHIDLGRGSESLRKSMEVENILS